MYVWWILLLAVLTAFAYLAVVAFGVIKVAPVFPVTADPAPTREAALAKLDALNALDTAEYAPACASALLEPDGDAIATIIVYHGFTNCPNQFLEAASCMRALGFRVLIPRQPFHGRTDVLNRDMSKLEVADLTAHVATTVDIAAGFGDPIAISGLSGGGVLACWAAVTRPEVDHVLVVAPAVEPTGIPAPLGRLMTRFRSAIPKYYFWWNPKKKADLGESPYVYPGFPLPGIIPYVHLGLYMADGYMAPGPRPAYAAMLANPGDFAVSAKGASRLFHRVFAPSREHAVREYTIEKELGWWHDFVDPNGPHVGTPEQVASVWLTALGFGEAGVAQGLMHEGALGSKR